MTVSAFTHSLTRVILGTLCGLALVAAILLYLFQAGASDNSEPDLGAAHALVNLALPVGVPLAQTLTFLHSPSFRTFAMTHRYADPTVCSHDYLYSGCTYGLNGDKVAIASRKKCPQCAVLNATLISGKGKVLVFWFVFDRSNRLASVSLDGYSESL
jgi:hypothetical protein